jgi:hypothetical protein
MQNASLVLAFLLQSNNGKIKCRSARQEAPGTGGPTHAPRHRARLAKSSIHPSISRQNIIASQSYILIS